MVAYQKKPGYNSIRCDMLVKLDAQIAFGALGLALVMIVIVPSCADKIDHMSKISDTLLVQVELRREQIASPDDQRLKQMQDLGLSVSKLDRQLVYIYVNGPLSMEQAEDLISLGIDVIEDTWIPAVGNHPLGFFIAEMPVDRLESLAARDYIARLDTAERKAQSQCQVLDY